MTTTSELRIGAEAGGGRLEPWWLPLAGIAFVATILAGFLIQGDTPMVDSSATDAVAFWTDHHGDGVASAYVMAWAAVLFVVFVGALVRDAHAASGPRTAWPLVMAGGGVLCTGGLLGTSWMLFTVSELADHDGSAQSIVALSALNANTPVLLTGGLGIMLLGAAGAYIPRAGAYRTLGWAGLVLGLGLYVPSFISLIAAILSVAWIITASVVATRHSR